MLDGSASAPLLLLGTGFFRFIYLSYIREYLQIIFLYYNTYQLYSQVYYRIFVVLSLTPWGRLSFVLNFIVDGVIYFSWH